MEIREMINILISYKRAGKYKISAVQKDIGDSFMKNRDTQYITILGWMRNMPEIKSNTELMAYALIYGFSQTEGQYLTCNQVYIAEWLGITRANCSRLLKNMEKRKLIKKILVRKYGAIKQYKYSCILPRQNESQSNTCESQNDTRTSFKTAQAYNIYNNIHNSFDNNKLYISHSKEEWKQFMKRDDYDFEQLEMELLCNQEYRTQDEEKK